MSRKKIRTVPRWKKLLVAALAAGTIGGGAIAAGNINYFRGEKVIAVYDGDTFIIENQSAVRLFGVDAPELGNCMGDDAKQALSRLVLGKRVQIRSPITDNYRRIMALVYVDTVFVNEVMIRAGLAEYGRPGENQTQHMQRANEYARSNHIGIYSPTCIQAEPPDPACTIKGNFDTKWSKKFYFTPACNNYSKVIIQKHQGDAWFCSEAEARKAGFTKAEACK